MYLLKLRVKGLENQATFDDCPNGLHIHTFVFKAEVCDDEKSEQQILDLLKDSLETDVVLPESWSLKSLASMFFSELRGMGLNVTETRVKVQEHPQIEAKITEVIEV